MKNFDYYLREWRGMFRLRSVLAMFSAYLLFVLSYALILSYFVGRDYLHNFAGESDIAVFYNSPQTPDRLESDIRKISGVIAVRYVSQEEALEEMKIHLGEELTLLERLKDNPFQSYFKVTVLPEITDENLDEIAALPFVQYVRDHRDVLDKVRTLTGMTAAIGTAATLLAFFTAAFITYYVSAENLFARSELIEILYILGAPRSFILRPFLWHSMSINIPASVFSGLTVFAVFSAWVEMRPAYLILLGGLALCSVLLGGIATRLSLNRVAAAYQYKK